LFRSGFFGSSKWFHLVEGIAVTTECPLRRHQARHRADAQGLGRRFPLDPLVGGPAFNSIDGLGGLQESRARDGAADHSVEGQENPLTTCRKPREILDQQTTDRRCTAEPYSLAGRIPETVLRAIQLVESSTIP
jgi:hypothetical protein